MLTKQQWNQHVETAAAHAHGERNASFYVWRRRLAGPWGVVLGAVVFVLALRGGLFPALLHRLQHLLGGPTGAFWALLALLTLGTVIAFRPTKAIRPAAATLIRGVIAVAVWIPFVFYAIAVIS
jgi:hypothetical protein